jgi:hypothetical protein
MVEVLVNPAWPPGVSLGLLREAHRLAWELRCGFDPPETATDDDVNHANAWLTASLAHAGDIDDRVRDLRSTPENGRRHPRPSVRCRR